MEGEARDKVALVTGAGSPTGIGFACAEVLGREGARLAIASTTERIHDRAAALHDHGYESAGFIADLTDRAQARRIVAEVLELFGRIDILVNNAGMVNVGMTGEISDGFTELADADWDLGIALNLQTAYNVTRSVAPGMVERGWGRIVMVSSVTGPVATIPVRSGYGAAKAGMDGLMRGLGDRTRGTWASPRTRWHRDGSRPAPKPPTKRRPASTRRWRVRVHPSRSPRSSRSSPPSGRATSRGNRSSSTAGTPSRR